MKQKELRRLRELINWALAELGNDGWDPEVLQYWISRIRLECPNITTEEVCEYMKSAR